MSNFTTNSVPSTPPVTPGAAQHQQELARRIKASVEAGPDAVRTCLDRLRSLLFSDRVAFFYDIQATPVTGGLRLTGAVERTEFREITSSVLQHLGHTVAEDRVEVVPNLEMAPEPFGVAVAPRVLTWSQPDLTGIPMDEALLGEPVYILKELPEVALIKTFTGYWGYAKKGEIRRLPRQDFVTWLNAPKAALVADFTAGSTRLPQGCRLPLRRWDENGTSLLAGPAGEAFAVPSQLCLRNQRERELALVVAQARAQLGAPYQLGGKNRETGIDCSGLIQLAYRAIGVSLARDARQQYLSGFLIPPCASEALLPGDVVFFLGDSGQVEHTGLYLGNQEIIHATPPQVVIQSMDPASSNYCKRFNRDYIGAKRMWW